LGSIPTGAPGILSQDIGTSVGQSYILTFAVFDESGSPGDTLAIDFGAFTASITGDQVQGSTTESFVIPAANITATLTTLTFTAENLLTNFNIDDVGLDVPTASIPEPAGMMLVLGSLAALGGSRALRLHRAARLRAASPA
jgi:hypothetical protein